MVQREYEAASGKIDDLRVMPDTKGSLIPATAVMTSADGCESQYRLK